MDITQRLEEIWNSDYINNLPSSISTLIRKRRYAFAHNQDQKDILITGINPSFRNGESEGVLQWNMEQTWYPEKNENERKYDVYWSPIRKILHGNGIDLRARASYLDIFYFREKDQTFLRSQLLSKPEGIRFVAEQLNLTMHIIEEIIKPKLIIVKNKESWAYFGRYAQEKGWIWMGYTFEPICESLPCGELWRITGLIDSPERIAPEITETALIGTFVLFTSHISQYTKREKRPTPELLQQILNSDL